MIPQHWNSLSWIGAQSRSRSSGPRSIRVMPVIGWIVGEFRSRVSTGWVNKGDVLVIAGSCFWTTSGGLTEKEMK